MENREFKLLRRRKDAQTIKEEYMRGKYGSLTDAQLEKICKESRDGGSIGFGRKMTPEQMKDRKDKLEEKAKREASPVKKRKKFLERINFSFKK